MLNCQLGIFLILKELFIDRSWIDINTGVFLREIVRSAAKTMVVDRKYRNALALPYLISEPLPNAANSSDVLRLDLILRELRVFFLRKCVRTAAKTMVVDRKNQKAPVRYISIFEIGTAAKYCELKRCRPSSQYGTDYKDEVFKSNLNFSLS